MNVTQRFYHSGATDDLHTVVEHARSRGYTRISLVGFSLGGNLTLKYLGEQSGRASIEKAVVFSVPMHLSSSSRRIEMGGSRVYSRRFNRSLKRKIQEKAARMPHSVDAGNLKKNPNFAATSTTFTRRNCTASATPRITTNKTVPSTSSAVLPYPR